MRTCSKFPAVTNSTPLVTEALSTSTDFTSQDLKPVASGEPLTQKAPTDPGPLGQDQRDTGSELGPETDGSCMPSTQAITALTGGRLTFKWRSNNAFRVWLALHDWRDEK